MGFEKILTNYDLLRTYQNDPTIWIGPEDGSAISTSLRLSSVVPYVVTTHKCTRKFGVGYAITDVTNMVIAVPRSDGGGANKWWFEIYDVDTDTLMGTVKDENGASAFVDGAALGSASTGIYIKLVWKAGTVALNDGDVINITTDVDAPLATKWPAEDITAGEIIYALSATGATYYAETVSDQTMRYGGDLHTPTGTDKYPYRSIETSRVALGGAFVNVHVLDSERYNEMLMLWTDASTRYQAASGVYPKHTGSVGQNAYTNYSGGANAVYNNGNAIFVNPNGDDANTGRWQDPFETVTAAMAAIDATRSVLVYGGLAAPDTAIFYESVTGSADLSRMVKEYGYTPAIEPPDGTSTPFTGGGTHIIQGWRFHNPDTSSGARAVDQAGNKVTIYDCTVSGGEYSIYADSITNWNIARCEVSGASATGIFGKKGANANITYNLAHDCVIGIDAWNEDGNIRTNHNISYGNIAYGFYFLKTGGNMEADVTYNLAYGNGGIGFYWYNPGVAMIGTINDNISVGNGGVGYFATDVNVDGVQCNAYDNTGGATGNVTLAAFNGNDGVDARYVDPILIDPENGEFGLGATSPVTHIPLTEEDIGPLWFLLNDQANGNAINGIEFDGNDQILVGVKKEGPTDYDDLSIDYAKISGCLGLGLDDYCDAAAKTTDTDVDHTIITGNGAGLKFWAGGNAVDDSLVYRNTVDNTYDVHNTAYNHIVNYGAQNGFNFAITGYSSTIKNCIIDGNSVLGIKKTGVAIAPTYCCITDAVSPVIDISDPTNFTDNPLFINVTVGSENFNIKTIEAGYSIDSACKDAGSSDVGAWQPDRAISSQGWKKYELEFNPKKLRFGRIVKGETNFNDGLAAADNWAKGFKRAFDLRFSTKQVSSEQLRNKMEAFTMFIKNRMNALDDDLKTHFRLHLKPDTFFDTGTATIDSTAKTLVDAAKSWDEFQRQGFHVGVKYESGVATGTIAAAGKTLTVAPDPGWDVDEWIGWEVYYNGYYYYVLSNTSDEITFSDPRSTLINGAAIDWAIEKYFKITVCEDDTLTVNDPDDELPDGSYEYYIDFIECRIQRSGFTYSQPTYVIDREHSKTGYRIRFEEL